MWRVCHWLKSRLNIGNKRYHLLAEEKRRLVRRKKRVIKTILPQIAVEEHEACDSDVCCSICFVNAVKIVYVPCGHVTACLSCTRATIFDDVSNIAYCSICSARIDRVQQLFEAGFE